MILKILGERLKCALVVCWEGQFTPVIRDASIRKLSKGPDRRALFVMWD